MPANFGEISGYHSLIAARHAALAEAAREQGDLTTASYHAGQAERYVQAAHEQKLAMRYAPGQPNEEKRPRGRPPEPPPVPLGVSTLLAVLRGAGHAAQAIRHSLSGRGAPPGGLSLH
jgi:hypothetical protein